MKQTFRTVALMVVLCTLAVGCQKETMQDAHLESASVSSNHSIMYSIDGIANYATFNSEKEWQMFLLQLISFAEEGRTIVIQNPETFINTKQTREIVTHTTRDEKDAAEWADKMQKKGYKVYIDFDEDTGIYTCTAIK